MNFGYTQLNPSDALDARHIFINDNTNGTPQKKGRIFDFRLDFLIPVAIADDTFLKIGLVTLTLKVISIMQEAMKILM